VLEDVRSLLGLGCRSPLVLGLLERLDQILTLRLSNPLYLEIRRKILLSCRPWAKARGRHSSRPSPNTPQIDPQ
jgi:hypothetical protein